MRVFSAIVVVGIAFAAQARADDKPSYQSLWDAVAQSQDCTRADDADLVIFTCDKTYTVWYFTLAGHPAHPGVISRHVIQTDNGVSVDEQGWSFASDAAQPAFKTFMAQIRALDEQLKESNAAQNSPAPTPAPPIRVGGNWQPQGSENDAIVSLTRRYFSLEDSGRYDDAYALFDAGLTAQMSFEQYRKLVDEQRAGGGQVKIRTVKAIDWENNSPLGPPGLYAALDYTAQTEKGQLCGYVAWKRSPDKFFTLVREETNIIPGTLSPDERAEATARFHCVE